MKRISIILLIFFGGGVLVNDAFAESQTVTLEASGLRESREPRVFADVVLFSYQFAAAAAPGQLHTVQAAFEHEAYGQLHSYQLNEHGVYLLIHERDPAVSTLRYRLVVDGVWTIDPRAPAQTTDRWGVRISEFPIPPNLSATVTYPHIASLPTSPDDARARETGRVDLPQRGMVEFQFRSEPGKSVALVGSFNGWDPYMTPMTELQPGLYSRQLRLTSGEHLYYFLVDGLRIPDPHNTDRRWSANGTLLSVVQLP